MLTILDRRVIAYREVPRSPAIAVLDRGPSVWQGRYVVCGLTPLSLEHGEWIQGDYHSSEEEALERFLVRASLTPLTV